MSWVASGPQTDVNSGNLTLNLPAGLQVGDMLIAVVHYGGQAAHGLVDWNQIVQFNGGGTSSRLSVWWHRWTGTTPNRVVTHISNNNPGIAGVAAFRGISSVLMVGATGAGTDSSIEHQSIDPLQDNVEVLAINGAADDNSRSLPSGWTALFEDPVSGTQHAYVFNASASPDESISILHRVLATGATGTVVSTMSASDPWASVIIALERETFAAHVGIANLEVPLGARRSFISIASAETPVAARLGRISFVETAHPVAARRSLISVTAVQVPVEAARALVSVASTQIPVAARDGRISVSNIQTPLGGRSSDVSVGSIQIPVAARSSLVSVADIQTPVAARDSRVSIAEWLVPLGQRAAAASFAVLQTPIGARQGEVSIAEYSLGDPGSDVAREMRRARLAAHTPLRSKVILNEVTTIIGDHSRNAVTSTPFIQLIPHPAPGRAIGIMRVFSRIRVHQVDTRVLSTPHQFILALFRVSDGSILGATVLDAPSLHWDSEDAPDHKEDDIMWGSGEFVLTPGDSLVAVGAVFGKKDEEYVVGLSVSITWR